MAEIGKAVVIGAGVMGGALVISGADFGEGSSVIQARTHGFAMKSSMWMLDPRPDLPNIVETVENAFALSEASNTPVIMELRVRACHPGRQKRDAQQNGDAESDACPERGDGYAGLAVSPSFFRLIY